MIVDKGANVRDLEIGDFVGLANNYCGKCEPCRTGNESQCKIRSSYDMHNGYKGRMGFANYMVRPQTTVVKMNPELDPSEAAFLEPVATVCKGMEKLKIKPFDNVVVIGAGTMGMVNALVARAYGANVIISELMDNKIAVAKEYGFEVIDGKEDDPVEKVKELTDGKGADVVIVAVGSTACNVQAGQMLKKMDGKMCIFAASYPSPEIGITANDIHYRRMEIIGTYLGDLRDFLRAAYLLNTGKVDVSKICEPHKYYLDDIQDAFAEASTPGKYRVSVLMHKD